MGLIKAAMGAASGVMGVRVIKHGGSEKKELKNKILSTNRNLKKQSTTHKQTIFFMEVSKNERS